MRPLHLEKKGLRGLSIAESFKQNSKNSILAGVVMRRDFVIDGFVLGKVTLGGDDATETILEMYRKLNRPDVSYLLISGIIISMYNIIDIGKISNTIQIPVIGVTYEDSKGISEAIKHHIKDSDSKLEQYYNLPEREKITLRTSEQIFVRREGCSLPQAKQLLNYLTLQGTFPEPLRIAQLLAKTLLQIV